MNEGEGRELIGREVVALNRALIERLGPVVGRAWGAVMNRRFFACERMGDD